MHSPRGDLRGHDTIRKNFQEIDAMLDGPSKREVHDILANDRHAIVLATDHMTKGGTTFDAQQVVVIHLRDGKAAEVWIHVADPQGMMQFMGA